MAFAFLKFFFELGARICWCFSLFCCCLCFATCRLNGPLPLSSTCHNSSYRVRSCTSWTKDSIHKREFEKKDLPHDREVRCNDTPYCFQPQLSFELQPVFQTRLSCQADGFEEDELAYDVIVCGISTHCWGLEVPDEDDAPVPRF